MAPFANSERGCVLETVKRLRPCYFGLCFVHMWIYCTTHRPSVSDELSTMAVMYLAQSAALVAMFLLARHSRSTGRQVAHMPQGLARCADVASALFMSACALVLAGVVPTGSAWVAGVASGLGGIGVTWAYARWCQFYAKLDLRLAAPLIFATMAVGSAGKAVIDLLGAIPASIGLAQLSLLDEFVRNRQHYCRGYNERLAGIPEVTTPDSDYKDVGPFIYFIRVPAEARQELIEFLKQRGVPTGIHFLGAHDFSFYRDARRGDLSVTDRVVREELTLPLWSYMDDEVLDRVAGAIREFFAA